MTDPQEQCLESPPHELTIANVQKLAKELEGLDRLYGSNHSIEGYVKTTEHLLGETSQEISKASPVEHRRHSSNSFSPTPPECADIIGLDGAVITRMSRSTQTDWNWVLQKHNQSFCSHAEEYVTKNDKPHLEHEEHKILCSEESETELLGENEETVTKSKDSQVPSQVENLTGKFDKIATLTLSSDSSVKFPECELPTVLCEYCRQAKKPPVTAEQLEGTSDPEKLFCCEVAWMMADLVLEKEEEEEEKASKSGQKNRKINDVELHPLSTEGRERLDQRLREWETMKSSGSYQPSGFDIRQHTSSRTRMVAKNTICYRLSNDLWNVQEEVRLPEMEIITPPETVTLPDREPGVKRKNVLVRHHKNGKTLVLIFPNGTGHIFYPSGRIAVLISSVHPGHFIYIILEDAPLLPQIQAIFTSRGQATCYHPNGLVCVNLTPLGGFWCTESGVPKRRWSWLDLSTHVHAPPYQPINMTLSPNISIRICTQDHIYLTFTSGKNSVRFNMGRLKEEKTNGLMMPGPDSLELYLQKKKVEMQGLLQHLQGSVTFKRREPGLVGSQYSLRAQGERTKEKAAKTAKAKLSNISKNIKRVIAQRGMAL